MNLQTTELIINIITFLIIAIFILAPFLAYFFLRKKIKIKKTLLRFGLFFLINTIIFGILTLLFTYWNEEMSKQIILNKFGFNSDGMNEVEYFQNVKPENKNRLKEIYESMFGIGWPLKAFFAFVIFSLPYNFLATLTLNIIEKIKRKKELQIT